MEVFLAGFALFIIIVIICIAIFVALARWVFRINDIVSNLESINDKLNSITSINTKSPVSGPDIEFHKSTSQENEVLKNDIPKL